MLGFGLYLGLRNNVGGFTLKSVSSLLHWYTFNTGQTLNTSLTPNRISAWADQKGSNNLTQSTENSQPKITGGILNFDSSTAQLLNDSDISLTNFTIILVVKTNFDADTILELSTFVPRGSSYEADKGFHDDMVMNLVMFGWFVSTEAFGDVDEMSLKDMLYKDRKAMEDDLLDFGFHNTGQTNEYQDIMERQRAWRDL